MEREGKGDSLFTCVMSLDQQAVSTIPQRYVLPSSQRPNPDVEISTKLPIIDLSSLHHQSLRPQTINNFRVACQEFGFFQVINHGIHQTVMDDAIEAAKEFFNLPNEEKMRLYSDDVHKPVRYGTSLNHARDEVYCWRDFIKHYSHPLSEWIHQWPSQQRVCHTLAASRFRFSLLSNPTLDPFRPSSRYRTDARGEFY